MAHKSAMDAVMERLYAKEQKPKSRKPRKSKRAKPKPIDLAAVPCHPTRH